MKYMNEIYLGKFSPEKLLELVIGVIVLAALVDGMVSLYSLPLPV